MAIKFKVMTSKPAGNPFYNTTDKGGYSQCVKGKCSSTGTYDKECTALANCVGFACGRYNQIYSELTGYTGMKYPTFYCNAENFIEVANRYGLKVSQTPSAGAIGVLQKGATLNGDDGAGHVFIVESCNETFTEITTSESGWNSSSFWNSTRNNSNGRWGSGSAYKFRGFIINPAVGEGVTNREDKAPDPTPIATNTTTYKVVKGDTLSGIGVKYNVNWKDIASLNGIKSPYTIYVGQTIRIPSTASTTKYIQINTTNGVWCRKGIGFGYSKYKAIPYGTKCELITKDAGRSNGYSWDKVIYNGVTVYLPNNWNTYL